MCVLDGNELRESETVYRVQGLLRDCLEWQLCETKSRGLSRLKMLRGNVVHSVGNTASGCIWTTAVVNFHLTQQWRKGLMSVLDI